MKLDPWQKLMQRGPGADPTSSQLEELGYSLLDPSVGLSGSFYTANLYTIRGLSAPDEVIVSNGRIQGNSEVTFGIGKRCNELANRITGLDFVDDEDQWSADDRHRPPFLLLQISCFKLDLQSSTEQKVVIARMVMARSFMNARCLRMLIARFRPKQRS